MSKPDNKPFQIDADDSVMRSVSSTPPVGGSKEDMNKWLDARLKRTPIQQARDHVELCIGKVLDTRDAVAAGRAQQKDNDVAVDNLRWAISRFGEERALIPREAMGLLARDLLALKRRIRKWIDHQRAFAKLRESDRSADASCLAWLADADEVERILEDMDMDRYGDGDGVLKLP